MIIQKKKSVAFFVLWVVLIATLLPYIYTRTEYKLLIYMVTVIVVIWAPSVILLAPGLIRLAFLIARNSPHFLIYCAWIFIAQSIAIFHTPELCITDYIWGSGFVIIGLIGYFIFPIFIVKATFNKFLALLTLIGVFSSAIAIYAAFTGETHILGFHLREVNYSMLLGIYTNGSIFYEANRFAVVAFVGLLGGLYLLSKRQHAFMTFLMSVLCLAGIAVSWSRAAYLAVLIAVPLWIITIEPSSRRKHGLAALFALLLFCGLISAIFFDPISQVFLSHGFAGRDLLWPAAISLILESPIFGYGFQTDGNQLLYALTGISEAAHCTPLSIALNAGVIALVLYLMTIWISLRRLQRSKLDRPEKATILAGITGMSILALFLDYTPGGLSYGTFLYTVFLGLGNASPWLQSIRTNSQYTSREFDKA